MNNFTFGDEAPDITKLSAVRCGSRLWREGTQTHMTNTRITDVEIIERRYPVLVNTFALRQGSAGRQEQGGDGLVREFTFLKQLVENVL